jgi:hypothetical protein
MPFRSFGGSIRKPRMERLGGRCRKVVPLHAVLCLPEWYARSLQYGGAVAFDLLWQMAQIIISMEESQ